MEAIRTVAKIVSVLLAGGAALALLDLSTILQDYGLVSLTLVIFQLVLGLVAAWIAFIASDDAFRLRYPLLCWFGIVYAVVLGISSVVDWYEAYGSILFVMFAGFLFSCTVAAPFAWSIVKIRNSTDLDQVPGPTD